MVALTAEIKNMDMVKTALKNDQPFHLSERKHPPAVIEFITPFPTPPPTPPDLEGEPSHRKISRLTLTLVGSQLQPPAGRHVKSR